MSGALFFYNFPVWPGEQRYLVTRVLNTWYVWTRATQGSRGAPLISGCGLAQAMRLNTRVVPTSAVRSSTYVDDPLITLVGAEQEADRSMAKVVLCLRALNYDLAFEKHNIQSMSQRLLGHLLRSSTWRPRRPLKLA